MVELHLVLLFMIAAAIVAVEVKDLVSSVWKRSLTRCTRLR